MHRVATQLARFADFDPPLTEAQEAGGLERRDLPLCQRLPPVLSAVAELADREDIREKAEQLVAVGRTK